MLLEPQAAPLEVRVDLVEVKMEMPLPPARRQQPLADDAAEVLGARADVDALKVAFAAAFWTTPKTLPPSAG